MALGAMTPLSTNGISPPAGISEKIFTEIRELEKILRLRDEVIAGTHPRIKVPAHLIGKLGPRPLQSPALATPRPLTAESNTRSAAKSGQAHQDEPVHLLQISPEPPTLKNAVSEIDPVLLTKSEDLVRAEIQLHRQRLERAIKEQLEQRRTESRQRHPHQEPVPDFDVSEVLGKALQIVQPVEGVGDESSEENSYYSSRQNDSPIGETENLHEGQAEQERPEPEEIQAEDMEIDDQPIAEEAEKQRVSPPRVVSRDSDYWSGVQDVGPYADELRRQPYPSISRGSKRGGRRGQHYYTTEPRDVYEGPSQIESSKEPRNEFQGSNDYIGLETEPEHYNRRSGEAPLVRVDSTQGVSRPTFRESPPEVTVVRNHISSPLAPRPERVSPLAVARVPALTQEHQHEELDTQRESTLKRPLRIHSPGSLSQSSVQRKRRQPFSNATSESRKISTRRVVTEPSPPQIKEEPLSPMPLASIPSIRSVKRGQQLQRAPSGDFMNRDSFTKPSEQSQQYREDPDIPSPVLPLRGPSRSSVRRVERDDPNLRRYASVRYSKRPQSPAYPIQVSPTESRPIRPSSHPFADRIVLDQHHHYREPPRSQLGQYPASVQSGRSRSPQLRERYPSIQQDAVIMAPPSPPPPRRAMDKYGREYIQAPTVIRHSVAPPGRQREVEPYYERATTRDPVMRMPMPVPDDLYSDHTFVERLPRLTPAPRRIVEQSPIDVDYRAYRERDYTIPQGAIPVAREEYVQNREYPEQRISQYEEIVFPQYIPRMQSARPETGRYEAARDFVPRNQSVRPEPVGRDYSAGMRHEAERRDFTVPPQGVREYSVRADESRREFVPADNPRYNYLPSGQRYTGDHSLIERPRDIPREAGADAFGDDMRKYRY